MKKYIKRKGFNYFDRDEFICPCCKKEEMDSSFIMLLDCARLLAETPFVISSGYRCKSHNKKVKGTIDSSHLKGLAADIKCANSKKRIKIINALITAGFRRIGVYKNFIHVDMDEEKNEVMWVG